MTLQVLIQFGNKQATLSSCGFSLHMYSSMSGLLSTVTLQGEATKTTFLSPRSWARMWLFCPLPGFWCFCPPPGFWDLEKSNTAIYYMLFLGQDAIDSGSLLQFARNILKTDGDNQCFLKNISSVTEHDCNIPSVNRNRMSC